MKIGIIGIGVEPEEKDKVHRLWYRNRVEKLRRNDTEISWYWVAFRPSFQLVGGEYIYPFFLNKREIIEAAIKAEKDGCDALVGTCFDDPAIEEARGVLDIAYVGPGESAMLFACLLGSKFGIVTLNSPYLVAHMKINIKLCGLEDRAILNPVRPISISFTESSTGDFEDPRPIAEDVHRAAQKCVEDGAEVVIIGCCGLAAACTEAGLAEVEGTGAPLLDPFAVALKTAEIVVDLRNKLGLPFLNRTGLYQQPSREILKAVRATYGLKTD